MYIHQSQTHVCIMHWPKFIYLSNLITNNYQNYSLKQNKGESQQKQHVVQSSVSPLSLNNKKLNKALCTIYGGYF